jgi:hypothetical protein
MQREKTALEYFVTNIFLLQKFLFRNPSLKFKNSFFRLEISVAERNREITKLKKYGNSFSQTLLNRSINSLW